ncbi:MAG: hypothetical protein ACKVOE_07940 [Rickettsiales bacterium]
MSGPITPPLPVNATISIQPLPTAIPSGVASDVPSVLAALAGGSTLQGFVINRDGQNNPVLRTNLGDVLVRSDVFIKTGSEVVIRVDATQPGRARIVSIDGVSPEDYVSQNARVTSEDSISNSTISARPTNATPTTANSSALEALVLKTGATALPLLPGETIPPRLTGLKPGQPLRVQILNAQLPQAAVSLASIGEPTSLLEQLLPAPNSPATPAAAERSTAPTTTHPAALTPPKSAAAPAIVANAVTSLANPLASTPTAPTSANPVTVASAPTTFLELPPAVTLSSNQTSPLLAQELATPAVAVPPSPSSAVPLTGKAVALPPIAVENPQLTPNAPFVPPSDALRGLVIGHEADGAAILQTPIATLKLYTAQPIPQGTTLSLHVTPGNAPTFTPLPVDASGQERLHATASDLQEALQSIVQLPAFAAAARDVTANIPTTNSHLASTLLFFLAAVKAADPRELLGARGVDKLRIFAPDLLSRLGGDLEQLQPLLNPPPGTPWGSIALPILVQGEVHSAYLYLKRDEEREGSAAGGVSAKHGQRFIVDVELSQLGQMQFDGFVREAAGQSKKQLDLVIRSSHALPEMVLSGIRERFTSTLEITGLTGQAVFQQGSQHFIRPQTAPPSHSAGAAKPILA